MKVRCQILLEDWQLAYIRKQGKLCKTVRKLIAQGMLYKSKTFKYDDLMYEARKEVEE